MTSIRSIAVCPLIATLCTSLYAFVGVSALTASEPALLIDFENAVAGSAPGANTVSPSTPVGATIALPIAAASGGPRGVVVGPYASMPVLPALRTGKFARIYDYNTGSSSSGTSLEYDFVPTDPENATAVRVEFKFAASTSMTTTEARALRFSVVSRTLTIGSGANRPFLLALWNDGNLRLDLSGTASDRAAVFALNSAHQVVLYLNDHESDPLAITGPDGAARSVAPNNVALFLDGVFIGVSLFDNTSNYRTSSSNLGRVGFTTLTSDGHIDFVIDDLRVDILRAGVNGDTPVVPPNFGLGIADFSTAEFDPEVLLWDRFAYPSEELRSASSARWTVKNGTATLASAGEAVLFDYAIAGSHNAYYFRPFGGGRVGVRDVTSSGDFGPMFFRAFDLTVEEAPVAGASGFFLAQTGPSADLTSLNGLLWIRAGGGAGTFQVGASTDRLYSSNPTANVANAVFSGDLAAGVTYRVVTRYDAVSNDTVLWIDPVNADSAPTLTAAKAGDGGTYQFTGMALRFNNVSNLGRFRVDDLRVATNFAAALAKTSIVQPVAEIRRSSTNLSIMTTSFDAYVTGATQLTFLRHDGLFWLASEGGAWTAAGSASGVNSNVQGSSFFKTYTLREVVAGGADEGRFTFMLQNNADASVATYRLALNSAVARQVQLGDGTSAATPIEASGPSAGDVVFRHDSGRVLRLTGFSRLAAVNGQQYLYLDVPARAVRTFSFTFEPLAVDAPLNWQVFQRAARTAGGVVVAGRAPAGTQQVSVEFSAGDNLLAPPLAGALPAGPQSVDFDAATLKFSRNISLPAGGWYRATIRARDGGGSLLAERTIDRFGVGEVFLASGQSNSTNSANANSDSASALRHNRPVSRLVSSFSGAHWQEGKDPQPGSHDSGADGSYYPQFGDEMAERFGVPIASSITGQGSTDVAEFLPTAPHNFTAIDQAYHNGLYSWLVGRARLLGPSGFRALLWHQGESDSTHKDGVTRTTQANYYTRLKTVITTSRSEVGWGFPWFVARASWWPPVITADGTPDGTVAGDPNIQAAQEQLWEEGIAYAGADTDSLGLEYRDLGGSRVHFATPHGTQAHAALWAERVGDYLDVIYNGSGARDSDGGGAPDYWERMHGFDPASASDDAADADGDGESNALEFAAGSDPSMASDRLAAQIAPTSEGSLRVYYRAKAGRTYSLYRSTTLVPGSWTEVERRIAAVDDSAVFFNVSFGAGETSAFFRIGVLLPE